MPGPNLTGGGSYGANLKKRIDAGGSGGSSGGGGIGKGALYLILPAGGIFLAAKTDIPAFAWGGFILAAIIAFSNRD